MQLQTVSQLLDSRQIGIYFAAVILAAALALLVPGTERLESSINPALALMLYVTFLQVPLAELRQALKQVRFLAALLTANFIIIPLLVAGLMQWLPADPLIRLGALLVLLTPCVDYVVTFSYLGRADARLLLAATPVLLIVQMLLLPVYLSLFLGAAAAERVTPGPFLHAFAWLIALPLALAALTQLWAARNKVGKQVFTALGTLPVPATAVVLFVVIAAVLPRLAPVLNAALSVAPVYIVFAIVAPLVGWCVSRLFQLEIRAGRAVTFSGATRNSLVVLPLAFAIPEATPLLPAIVVTQTLVELLSELVYIRFIARLGNPAPAN